MEWPILSDLSEEERRDVLRLARRRQFRRNEVVFHEGDPGNTIHLVARGHLAIRVTTPLGDVVTLRLLGPGEHFGEMALIAPAPRVASMVAVDNVETLSVHKDNLDEIRSRHPGVDQVFIRALVDEVRRLSAALVEALHVPVEKRLFRRLVEVAAIYGGEGAVVPLTQEDLAQLAGTTRPTANRVLRSAEEAGAVRVGRGKIEVLDTAALTRRAR